MIGLQFGCFLQTHLVTLPRRRCKKGSAWALEDDQNCSGRTRDEATFFLSSSSPSVNHYTSIFIEPSKVFF
jgi:hypothetical protein